MHVSIPSLDFFFLVYACNLCTIPNGLTFVDGITSVSWRRFSTTFDIGRVKSTSTFSSTIFLQLLFLEK